MSLVKFVQSEVAPAGSPWFPPADGELARFINDIVLEEEEMAEAGWYKADELPPIPPKISIARRLIDWFVTRHAPETSVEEWTFKE